MKHVSNVSLIDVEKFPFAKHLFRNFPLLSKRPQLDAKLKLKSFTLIYDDDEKTFPPLTSSI